MKMYAVGVKNDFLFQDLKVVKAGRNWSAGFRHRHFVIRRGPGGGGGSPQHSHPWGSISAPGIAVPVFAPPHQTIWSTFSPCLRMWPILCTQFYDDGKGGGWKWWG